jgi:hypothetical protein
MTSEDRRPLTILIPKPFRKEGYCNINCVLWRMNSVGAGCLEGLAKRDDPGVNIMPGFGCPWGITKLKKKKKRKEKYVYSPEQPDGGFI